MIKRLQIQRIYKLTTYHQQTFVILTGKSVTQHTQKEKTTRKKILSTFYLFVLLHYMKQVTYLHLIILEIFFIEFICKEFNRQKFKIFEHIVNDKRYSSCG